MIVAFLSGVCSFHLSAQKKVEIGFNLGIYKPIGTNKAATYTFTERPLTLNYFTRKRYKNFYYDLLLSARTQLNERIVVGVEMGFYLNFREPYFSDTAKTHTPFTTRFITNVAIINAKKFQVGIEGKASLLLTNIHQAYSTMKKGSVFGAAIFYNAKTEGASVNLGFEQQNYTVKTNIPATILYKQVNHQYKLARLALNINCFIPFSAMGF